MFTKGTAWVWITKKKRKKCDIQNLILKCCAFSFFLKELNGLKDATNLNEIKL